MTIKELIEELEKCEDKSRKVYIASDEEWNSIFKGVLMEELPPYKNLVLFPDQTSLMPRIPKGDSDYYGQDK